MLREAVTEYFARRFNQRDWPANFARMLHGCTDANAPFLVNTISSGRPLPSPGATAASSIYARLDELTVEIAKCKARHTR